MRTFAQDDAHIFCTPEQVPDEVESLTRMILECYTLCGFANVQIFLSTRPPDRAGSDELWDRTEAALEGALKKTGHPYTLSPGDGAFYGPKIDFIVQDALAREHQLGTIQLDYVLPERFDLSFIDAEDREHRPVMIHRAMLGSIERFLGILIEHCAADFPLWLAPEQMRVLSITDRAMPYAEQVRERLEAAGFRAHSDVRNEKIGAKIRQAELEKIPFMLVVGDREADAGTVAVRAHKKGDQGAKTLDQFIDQATSLVDEPAGPSS